LGGAGAGGDLRSLYDGGALCGFRSGGGPRGRVGRGFVGEALTPRNACIARGPRFEVEEDGGDDGRIGQEREVPCLSTTGGTTRW
jgi:hypothetical protein